MKISNLSFIIFFSAIFFMTSCNEKEEIIKSVEEVNDTSQKKAIGLITQHPEQTSNRLGKLVGGNNFISTGVDDWSNNLSIASYWEYYAFIDAAKAYNAHFQILNKTNSSSSIKVRVIGIDGSNETTIRNNVTIQKGNDLYIRLSENEVKGYDQIKYIVETTHYIYSANVRWSLWWAY